MSDVLKNMLLRLNMGISHGEAGGAYAHKLWVELSALRPCDVLGYDAFLEKYPFLQKGFTRQGVWVPEAERARALPAGEAGVASGSAAVPQPAPAAEVTAAAQPLGQPLSQACVHIVTTIQHAFVIVRQPARSCFPIRASLFLLSHSPPGPGPRSSMLCQALSLCMALVDPRRLANNNCFILMHILEGILGTIILHSFVAAGAYQQRARLSHLIFHRILDGISSNHFAAPWLHASSIGGPAHHLGLIWCSTLNCSEASSNNSGMESKRTGAKA